MTKAKAATETAPAPKGDQTFEVTSRSIKGAQTRRKNKTRQQVWYWNKVTKPLFAQLEAGEAVVVETKAGRKITLQPV